MTLIFHTRSPRDLSERKWDLFLLAFQSWSHLIIVLPGGLCNLHRKTIQ